MAGSDTETPPLEPDRPERSEQPEPPVRHEQSVHRGAPTRAEHSEQRGARTSPAQPAPPDPPRPVGEPQRYGPLIVERYVKDDGRSLILFALSRDPEAPAPAPGGGR